MSRVWWVAAGVAAAMLGVSGCGGDETGRPEDGVSATASAAPRPEDSGPITRAKMRVVLDTIAADVGAPPNDPDWARSTRVAEPGTLQECAVSYKGFETAADPSDVERTDALEAELTARGWTKSPGGQTETADDGTVDTVRAYFEKRGWSLTVDYRIGHGSTLSLTAFDDACVTSVMGPTPGPGTTG